VAEEAREAVQEEAEARQLDEENKPKLAKKVSEPVSWKEVEQNTKLAASKAEAKGERAFSGETEQATVLAPVQSWPAIEKILNGWRLVVGHEYLQFVVRAFYLTWRTI